MISCILLAAGLSSRFHSPKALAVLPDGRKVIEYVQQSLIDSNVDEIILVTGAQSQELEPFLLKHTKITSVHNKDYYLGQTSSFKTGLRKVSARSLGILLMPVDCPFIPSQTINRIIEFFLKNKESIVIPTYQDRRGHPPLFPIHLKELMLLLKDSEGLNTFEHAKSATTLLYPVQDPAVLWTFNTPEEFENLKKKLEIS